MTYSNIVDVKGNVSRLILRKDRQALIKLSRQSGEIVANVKSRNWSLVSLNDIRYPTELISDERYTPGISMSRVERVAMNLDTRCGHQVEESINEPWSGTFSERLCREGERRAGSSFRCASATCPHDTIEWDRG